MFKRSVLSFLLLTTSPLTVFSFSRQRATPPFSAVQGHNGSSFARTGDNAFAVTTNLQMNGVDISVDTSSAKSALKDAKETLKLKTEQAKSSLKKPISLTTQQAVMIGTVLAMTSGFINGACVTGFFSASQATAAVTGTWTNAAIAAATGQNAKFLTLSKYLFSFMTGSTIAGLLSPDAVPFEVAKPNGVAASFGIGALALSVAGLMAKSGGLSSEAILCLCFIANGIQNSLTSAFTANLCRTTHFSGITSDIGTFLGQAIRGNRNNILKLKVFPLLAFAFWSGSFIAYPLTKAFGSNTLLGAATVYGGLAASVILRSLKK